VTICALQFYRACIFRPRSLLYHLDFPSPLSPFLISSFPLHSFLPWLLSACKQCEFMHVANNFHQNTIIGTASLHSLFSPSHFTPLPFPPSPLAFSIMYLISLQASGIFVCFEYMGHGFAVKVCFCMIMFAAFSFSSFPWVPLFVNVFFV